MKSYAFVLVFLFGIVQFSTQDSCSSRMTDEAATTLKMEEYVIQGSCYDRISEQIHQEMTAAISYLAMGAHFSKTEFHRPGVANFFFTSANEERMHAKQMLNYLLKRGGSIANATAHMKTLEPFEKKVHWEKVEDALRDSLKMEQMVTTSIYDIIKACEKTQSKYQENDYHAVDHFTGEFLDEQHEGVRKISGFIVTLNNMERSHGTLSELMFDKHLVQIQAVN